MHDAVLGANGVQGVSTFYEYYMLEAMAKADEIQHGIETIRDYWGGMPDMGATSLWEDFDIEWTRNAFRIDELPVPGKQDIHGDFGQFCYEGFRHSLCHGWASGPAPWLTAHVLGIQVAETGCRKVRINPFLGDLAWAEGTFPTPMGVIKVRHERTRDGEIKSDVALPDGVSAPGSSYSRDPADDLPNEGGRRSVVPCLVRSLRTRRERFKEMEILSPG